MFCACIMSFVWRTGTTDDENRGPTITSEARIPRIIITVVFSLGIIYFFLIVRTLRRYGQAMDRAWRSRIMTWIEEKVIQVEGSLRHHSRSPSQTRSFGDVRIQRAPSKDSEDSMKSERSIDISVVPPSRPVSPASSLSPSLSSSYFKEPNPPLKSVQQSTSSSGPQQIPYTISADNEIRSTASAVFAGGDQHITEKILQIAPHINVTRLFNISPNSTSAIVLLPEEILTSCLLGKEDYEKLALVSELFFRRRHSLAC